MVIIPLGGLDFCLLADDSWEAWIPAFAGMTGGGNDPHPWIGRLQPA